MRTHRLVTIVLGILAVTACREATPPTRAGFVPPSFLVTPMFVDTIGICLGTGSPSGSYTFAYTIQNQQPGDINDVPSPVTATLNPHECLVAWRRLTPLPAGVVVTAIVDVLGVPPAAKLDSVELQDRSGTQVTASPTDTVRADTDSGGALTYYLHLPGKRVKRGHH